MIRTSFAVIGFMVVALVVGVCVACDDDDDNGEDGWAPSVGLVASSERPGGRDGPGRDGEGDKCEDQGSCNDYRDCFQSQDYCSDDDQVQVGPICVEDGACSWES